MAQIDLRHAVIRISDGGGSFIDIKVGEGDVNYVEKREIDFVKSRGVLDTTRENEEQPVEVSIVFIWEFLSNGGSDPPTVEDALKKVGAASGWTSANTDDALAPYSVNIAIIYTPPCPGVPAETILLSQFHYSELAHSLKDASVAMKGSCNVKKAHVTRG